LSGLITLIIKGLLKTALWISAWSAVGYSFASWKEKQEVEYVKRLQYLIDRKERRDKWDKLYEAIQAK
jgi:hypothetical protein